MWRLVAGIQVFLLLDVVNSQTTINGLEFPSNGEPPADAFVAIQLEDPQDNGLPIWGPDHAGVTWIWEYKPEQQTGYYVTFWWSENSDLFTWDGGNGNTYYGCHPYPTTGSSSGTSHYWELAGMETGADNLITRGGSPQTVSKGNWYTQAYRVVVNANGKKTGTFFINLPDTSAQWVIEHTSTAGFGETNPPNPAVTFGDSPWYASYQHERLSGVLGRIKIITGVLSPSDLFAEAADMTRLVTQGARDSIWWGINNFESVDDLTCDYGSGRSFMWAGTQKATLVPILDGPVPVELMEFSADISGGTVSLFWRTASENANFGFDVQRRKSGETAFQTVGFVAGNGTTVTTQDYRFEETGLSAGNYEYRLKQIDLNGDSHYSPVITVRIALPLRFELQQNYPNPFNSGTTITYQLSKAAEVELTVHSMTGQKVAIVSAKRESAGTHKYVWDASTFASGVYFYRLAAGEYVQVRKMILIK
jgi:hypothetical protein